MFHLESKDKIDWLAGWFGGFVTVGRIDGGVYLQPSNADYL